MKVAHKVIIEMNEEEMYRLLELLEYLSCWYPEYLPESYMKTYSDIIKAIKEREVD